MTTMTVDFTPKPPRDSQRARVYRAECSAWEALGGGLEFADCFEIRRAALRAVDAPWWTAAGYPEMGDIRIGLQREGSGASSFTLGATGYLRFEPEMLDEATLAHELAHLAQPDGTAAHGREFCAAYLEIAAHLLGYRYASALRAAFDAERVAYAIEEAA